MQNIKNNIYYILPALNESQNIEKLFKNLNAFYKSKNLNIFVIYVNDGSTDDTIEKLNKIKSDLSKNISLKIINHEKNLGLGQALKSGFIHCFSEAKDQDILITMDTDNSHTIDQSYELFQKILVENADIAIASRYVKDSKIRGLKNIRILDIGCGGGLLCEPLSKLGAEVVGIDASEKNIKIAKLHSIENNLKINYFCASPENFKIKGKFDVILNMEIVEHVENVNFFLNQSTKFLKKKGLMFVATLNKTLKSFFFAIIGAEYVLRWLPIGTHDWDMFIEPKKLINICKNNNLILQDLFGVKYNLINNDWEVSKDTSINYLAKFEKY